MLLEACILSLAISMGFILSPMYLGCILLTLSVFLVINLCVSVSAWAGIWTWLVYLSGILVLFLFICSLSPSPSVMNSTWMWVFLLLSTCVGSQQFVSLHAQLPPMAMFFQDGGPLLFIWIGSLLFILMVVVSKISPYGFIKTKMIINYINLNELKFWVPV